MKVRTSVLRAVAFLTLGSLTMAACDEKTVQPLPTPPAVTVNVVPAAVTLQQGATTTLVAQVQNATNTAVTWASANTAVATVSATGQVTAVAPGTAVITATSAQDPNARGASAVTVTAPPPPPPITLQLVPAAASVQQGGTVQLVSIVGGTTNQNVTYVTSAASVATVSATGLVTAVGPGTAVITARTVADPTVAATSTITVTTTPPGPQPTISITPTAASVQVNGTQQFVANVQNATNTAVIWRTSPESVATISATGLATGVAPGTAVVTAIAAADTTVRVSATLNVTAAPPVTQPAISLQSVQSPINNPIAAGAGIGTGPTGSGSANLRVVVNVSAGSEALIQRVDIRFTDTAGTVRSFVCQNFTPPLAATQGVQTIDCVINTQALDANGQPRLPNGTYTLSAAAFSSAEPEGAPVAVANFGTVIVDNADTVNLTIEALGAQAVGTADNLLWREGDVRVTATPAMFGGGTVTSVRICLDLPPAPDAAPGSATTNPCRNVTSSTGGVFTTTFPKANSTTHSTSQGVANVSNRNVRPYVTSSVTAEGVPAPTTVAGTGPTIRLDNLAPDAPTTNPWGVDRWLAGTFTFNRANVTTHTAAALEALDPLPGVGGVTLTFHVFAGTEAQYTALGTSALARMQAVVTQGQEVTSASQLAGTEVPAGYIMVVRARDALGNTTLVRVDGQFGVDLVAPDFTIVAAIATGSPANNTINPATAFQFDFPFVEGNVSGTIFNPEVRIIRYTSNPNLTRCVNVNTGATTTVPTAGCAFVVAAGFTVPVRPEDGYYEYTFRFRDNAGNLSRTESRIVMRDNTAPVVAVSGTFSVSESSVTTGGTVTDTVDIRGWDQRLAFAGAAAPMGTADATLPIAPMQVVGTFGITGRVGAFTIPSTTITFWRTLTVSAEGAGPQAIGARTTLSGAGFGAFDVARNFASAFRAVTPDVTGAATPAGLETLDVLVSSPAFCNGINPRPSGDQGIEDCTMAGITYPSTGTVTVIAEGPTGFVRPFAVVHFYRVDPNGNVIYLGQSTQTVAGSVGDRFQHRWTFALNTTGWQGSFAANDQGIFAVGVTTATDAFRTPVRSITVLGAANQPGTGTQP
jgi:uncharacterized protein YjdB